MSGELEPIEKPASVLPEAFYDLLARVVPGAVLLYFIYPTLYDSAEPDKWGLVAVKAVGIGYLLGFFLDALADLMFRLLGLMVLACSQVGRCCPRRRSRSKSSGRLADFGSNLFGIQLFHDWVKEVDNYQKPLGVKMHGEKVMFRSLSLIFLYMALVAGSCVPEVLPQPDPSRWSSLLGAKNLYALFAVSLMCFGNQAWTLSAWRRSKST